MRMRRSLAALIPLAAGLLLAMPGVALASSSFDVLLHVKDNLGLQANGPGNQVTITTSPSDICTTSVSGGGYRLKVCSDTSHCIAATSSAQDARAIIANCDGSNIQRWTTPTDCSGSCRNIRNWATGTYLGVECDGHCTGGTGVVTSVPDTGFDSGWNFAAS